jgi:HAD superfamily hydrolase (TIGR01509 family)
MLDSEQRRGEGSIMANRGIFFDAAGVLYCRATPTEDFAIKSLREAGFVTEVSSDNLARQLEARAEANKGKLSHEAYWNLFLEMRGVANVEQRKTMVKQIIDYSNSVKPVPGNSEALEGLKRRGFILGIVTDTMYPIEWKMRRLETAGVAQYIDVVACSSALGIRKPDPAMYLDALRQAGLTPAEASFVGHDAAEINGAKKAGITTIAVNYDPGVIADYYCSSMLDLLNVPIFQKAE